MTKVISGPSVDFPEAQALIVPGAAIEARRYLWLAEKLAAAGIVTELAQCPGVDEGRKMHGSPATPKISEGEMLACLRRVNRIDLPLFLIGHSWGGAVCLDSLVSSVSRAGNGPMAAKTSGLPSNLAGCVTLGSCLQRTIGPFTVPGRQDNALLYNHREASILLIAASEDRMAPPDAVESTCKRIRPTASFALVHGGNHLQWATEHGLWDRPDFDGTALISAGTQRHRTIELILSFIGNVLSRNKPAL